LIAFCCFCFSLLMNECVGSREKHACVREGNIALLVYITIHLFMEQSFFFALVVLISAINYVYVLLLFLNSWIAVFN
jgi:hypothetical protein